MALPAACATAALVGASLIVPGAAQAATTETFVDGTGGVVADNPFDWTVPAGVTSIEVVADGAGGGGGYYYPGSPLDSVGTGGSGARVTASLTVTPGQVLVLTVGGPGVGGDITASAGGTGGRASSVADKVNPTEASILTIAGGGGGGGGANIDGASGSAGGNGGGVAGAGESGQTLSMTVDPDSGRHDHVESGFAGAEGDGGAPQCVGPGHHDEWQGAFAPGAVLPEGQPAAWARCSGGV